MISRNLIWLWLASFCSAALAHAQSSPDLSAILKRLDRLEHDNRELKEEVRKLRERLDPQQDQDQPAADAADTPANIEERRIEELSQTKVEASQKMPLSITGMLLFNAFDNGRHSGTSQDPLTAPLNPGPSSDGASVRQTVLGLKFDGPGLPGGGQVTGSLFMDFYGGSNQPFNALFRIRTASLDLGWANTTISVGQDKPIFAPREPNSLAQVGYSPLTAAGNLWDWQPQARIEQRFRFGEDTGVRAQLGVYQTEEDGANVPTSLATTLEHARPALEGRFNLWHAGGQKRFEVAPGFHVSETHVAGVSVPSRLVSLDWLIRPISFMDITGAWFSGENVANLGALRQGFTVLPSGQVIPVHSVGGWLQTSFQLTRRLTWNIYGGQQRDRGSDLNGSGIRRNFEYASNVIYRLAPNVLVSFEASQVRTSYVIAGVRLNNHYDLALGYLF